jgi:hypothetical protein
MPVIVGSVRSGTTLLSLMLNAHPDLAMGFESYFVAEMGALRSRWERPEGFDLDRFVDDLLDDPAAAHFRRRFGLAPELLRERLNGVAPIGYSDAARGVYDLYASSQGCTRYGEKTAGYVLGLPSIAATLPEARFLHLVRDGRDAARSHADARWGPSDYVDAGRYWAQRVRAIRSFGDAVGAGRYLELRYEELAADPQVVLKELCAFVDLDYAPQMLRYVDNGTRVLRGIRGSQVHRSANLPPTTGLRDWRRDASPQELELFEAAVGPVLTEFGYERACPRVSRRTQVQLQIRRPVTAMRQMTTRLARRRQRRARGG